MSYNIAWWLNTRQLAFSKQTSNFTAPLNKVLVALKARQQLATCKCQKTKFNQAKSDYGRIKQNFAIFTHTDLPPTALAGQASKIDCIPKTTYYTATNNSFLLFILFLMRFQMKKFFYDWNAKRIHHKRLTRFKSKIRKGENMKCTKWHLMQ